jgi:hypothetical protein
MVTQRLIYPGIALLSILSFSACGNKIRNENIPPSHENLGTEGLSPQGIKDGESWMQLAAALGIDLTAASNEAELRSRRESRSTLLGINSRTQYVKYLDEVKEDWLATAYSTQCSTVSSIEEIHPARSLDSEYKEQELAGVRVFQMKYKLQTDLAGTAESPDRSGLLIMADKGPHAKPEEPILVFAHGGTGGLSYRKLIRSIGSLQSGHVIVAPTYPGEPLCMEDTNATETDCDAAGVRAEPVGEKSAYEKDGDEVLGMYDCVLRSRAGFFDTPDPLRIVWLDKEATPTNFSTALALAVPVNGSGEWKYLPQSLIVGESRGAMTAMLALAKAGVQYEIPSSRWGSVLSKQYSAPSLFSCAAFVGPPVGMTSGRLQLGLEHLVKGTYGHSSISKIPGFGDFESLVKDYRENPDVTHLNSLVVEIIKHDPMLMSPIILKALRNWSSLETPTSFGKKSAMLFLHGLTDPVVPFDQTRIAHNTFMNFSDSEDMVEVSKSAGTYVTTRGFIADSVSSDASANAVEEFYQRSHAVLPGDFLEKQLVKNPLVDALLESTAKNQTEPFFGTRNPSDKQLGIVRNYIGGGYFANFKVKLSDDGTVVETMPTGSAGVRPADLLEEWRYKSDFGCQRALTRALDN